MRRGSEWAARAALAAVSVAARLAESDLHPNELAHARVAPALAALVRRLDASRAPAARPGAPR